MSQWILPAALGAAGLGFVVVGSAARKRSPSALVSSALASELAQAVTVPPMRGLQVTPLTTEPTLEELAAVVARARFYGPVDGEDNEGSGYKDPFSQNPSPKFGVEAITKAAAGESWTAGEGWSFNPEQARWWLIRSLLEAVEVGVDRGSTSPNGLIEKLYNWPTPETQTQMAGATIKFALAYLLSPTLYPDIRQRAQMLYLATQDVILRPTVQEYAKGRWFGQTWHRAGGGRSEATGEYFRNRSSKALWGGVGGLVAWQQSAKGQLDKLMADWRSLYGVSDLTIGSATVPQLATLIVSLATLFMRLAADKTAQWPAGAPSKVDTWGAVQQVMGAFFSASVAAFTGNYMAYADIVLQTAGVGPIPPKAKEAIEGGASYLAQL